MLKIENFISRTLLKKLSGAQKKEILCAIKNKFPVMFTGDLDLAYTMANELKTKGVVAFTPETLCTVELGAKIPKKKEFVNE
ncbi:MAG: hypothetical protein FWC97_00480 [Treponema sp.]|nr:hypothetical protein [Treponema sp.]